MTVLLSSALDLPPTVPDGRLGAPYAAAIQARGATSPYTYTASGALPPGLSLDPSTGVLSGVPSEEGTFAFSVTVLEFNACRFTRSISLTVGPGRTPPVPPSAPNRQTRRVCRPGPCSS